MPINNRLTQYRILQKVQCICMYICTIKPILGHACLVSIATQVNLHLPYGRVRIGSSDHLVVSVSYTSILEKKEFSPLCPLNTQILLPMVVTPKILREKTPTFQFVLTILPKNSQNTKSNLWKLTRMSLAISRSHKNFLFCVHYQWVFSFLLTGIVSDFFHLRQHGPCVSFDIVGHQFSGGVGVLQYSSHCIQCPLHWYQTTQCFCSWHWGQLSKRIMLFKLCFTCISKEI